VFVREFPAWDIMPKEPSNGLVHAATQITNPANGASLGSTIMTEASQVGYTAAKYNRATFPVAVFAVGRGVTFKEMAAVRQGGANYDPMKSEMANGMVQLAQDCQYALLQGNATNATGTLTTEAGLYNQNAFDGFRGVLGSQGSFNTNNAIAVDVGSLNYTETLQAIAAKSASNGGKPRMAFLTITAKQALDSENQNNQRYNNDFKEIIPGVNANQIQWANGLLTIVAIPGNTMGNYVRSSDSALVEDMYVLDPATNIVRWLYSEGFTVLQIPSGVDNILSERYIVFGMYGLEQAAPLFNGKGRKIVS
jgi:hypothetical protein